MNSEKSRKSFLVALAAAVAAVFTLPRLFSARKQSQARVRSVAALPVKLRQDPRSVSREDSRFV